MTTNNTSLLRVGENCCAVAHADRVAMLVDGEAYFSAFMRAAERAQRSIVILGWDFDSRTPLHFDAEGKPGVTLGEFLNRLAAARRSLQIHVLDWDYPMVFGTGREFSPLYGLTWRPHRRVHFRYDNTHPVGGSHHQKIITIDDNMAFVGGLDLTCKRWDTPAHNPDDARRMAGGKPYPPFHDIMIAVDGEPARAVAEIARKRWQKATHHALAPVHVRSDPWPPELAPAIADAKVGVACTVPANGQAGVRNVEQLYLDMIAGAQRYIYIENQYFTAHRIGAALAKRLAEPDGPEIVLVTRLLSHGWLEEMTMEVLRTKLIRDLRAADNNGRFHAYYPHIEGLVEGTCIDVHSKVMIVDDQWLRIGSSNLSNRSMGMDTECDLVVDAAGDDKIATGIRAFRNTALAEHVGAAPATLANEIERAGSMSAAIAALSTAQRGLQEVEDIDKWSDAVINTVALADPERPVSVDMLVEQFAPDVEVRRVKPVWLKLGIAVLVLLALTLAWRFTPLAEFVTAERVTQWAEQFSGKWWAPLLVIFAYTPVSLIMFPRPLLTLAAVVAFGPWLGFVYAMTGILLSAAVHFAAGKLFPRDIVRRMAGERLNRMTHTLRNNGLVAITALRLVPIAPFAVEGVVAGAIGMKFWHLMVGTFIAMLPGVLAATVFADQLQAALSEGRINYWLVAGVALGFVVAMLLVRRWFNRLELRQQPAQTLSRRVGHEARPARLQSSNS